MKYRDTFYLPSGRVFLYETDDGCLIESTEMQDVTLEGKEHSEVRSTLDPRIVWKHLVPKTDKWLMTVSTQKGCAHNCKFCDVAPLPFKGNLTKEEIVEQFDFMMRYTPIEEGLSYKKLKLGFARMGEPSWNLTNVLSAMKTIDKKCKEKNIRLLPCFNSILPRTNKFSPETLIEMVLDTKDNYFDGFLHFQVSCNSTDEEVRKELFGGANVTPLEDVIRIVNNWKTPKDIKNPRTVTLNFIVMKGVPIDVKQLQKYGLSGDKFAVKLIPLNTTMNSMGNNLETLYNYNTYEELKKLASEFKAAGIPVIYDAIAKCEEAGLCCGQLAHIFKEKYRNS